MLRCSKKRKNGGTSEGMPPLAYPSLKERMVSTRPRTSEAFWRKLQTACQSIGGGCERERTIIVPSTPFLPVSKTGGIGKARLGVGLPQHSLKVLVAGAPAERPSSLCGFDHLSQRPYRSRNSSGHRRSHSQSLVNPAEVVPNEIQRQGRSEVFPFFREGVGQARKSANLHSHREILALNVGRANLVEVWVSPLWERHGIYDFGRRIAVFTIGRRRIDFHQLCVIDARSQAVINGFCVRPESIRCQLESACRCFVEFFDENVRIPCGSPSKMPRENQFCVAFDGNKAIGVPALGIAGNVALFLYSRRIPTFRRTVLRTQGQREFSFQGSARTSRQSKRAKTKSWCDAGQ